MPKNAFYAQSGGVTAVINASACGVIETAKKHAEINRVFAGHNGIIGALLEELIDTYEEPEENIKGLKHTPAGAFGSCRYKLKSLDTNLAEYERLIDVFKAHDIGYFFYNGGGDSADTCLKISQLADKMNYPIQAIHIPKTIDNDLPFTDSCPGFGSVAKYVATSTMEAGLDIASMCKSSTKVFIFEVMGRHAGWIAGAAGLASRNEGQPPHLILFPEIAFDEALFLDKVQFAVEEYGYCVIVASEGAQYADGKFVADSGNLDAFGHKQLGGVAPVLAEKIKSQLGYKYHYAIADYLQRSARHIASKTDVEQAYALGAAAVNYAIQGDTGIMPYIHRDNDMPYEWHIKKAPLTEVANVEKMMPRDFITVDGFHITDKAKTYFSPLVSGEDYPPFQNGLPHYVTLKKVFVEKKLNSPFLIK